MADDRHWGMEIEAGWATRQGNCLGHGVMAAADSLRARAPGTPRPSPPIAAPAKQEDRLAQAQDTYEADRALAAANQELVEPLTPRELEVLGLVCDGASNLDIAARLDVSLATVKFHVNQIFNKLGVKRRTQAIVVAIYLHIVRPGWLAQGDMLPLRPL